MAEQDNKDAGSLIPRSHSGKINTDSLNKKLHGGPMFSRSGQRFVRVESTDGGIHFVPDEEESLSTIKSLKKTLRGGARGFGSKVFDYSKGDPKFKVLHYTDLPVHEVGIVSLGFEMDKLQYFASYSEVNLALEELDLNAEIERIIETENVSEEEQAAIDAMADGLDDMNEKIMTLVARVEETQRLVLNEAK